MFSVRSRHLGFVAIGRPPRSVEKSTSTRYYWFDAEKRTTVVVRELSARARAFFARVILSVAKDPLARRRTPRRAGVLRYAQDDANLLTRFLVQQPPLAVHPPLVARQ